MTDWPIITAKESDMGKIGGMPDQRAVIVREALPKGWGAGTYYLIPKDKVRIDSAVEGNEPHYDEVYVYPGDRVLIVRGNTDD